MAVILLAAVSCSDSPPRSPSSSDLATLNETILANRITAAIPDTNLRHAVLRAVTALPAYLDTSALDSLISLSASSSAIQSIDGIAILRRLRTLDLSANRITDIAALAALRDLVNLDLSGNRVADLTPIADLPSLQLLLLDDNLVKRLDALLTLPQLVRVSLSNNPVAAGDIVLTQLASRGVEVVYSIPDSLTGDQANSELASIIVTRIAFASNRDGDYDLYVLLPDSSELRLTDLEGDEAQPAWSPDGQRLAFIWSKIPDAPGSELYVMNRDGSDLRCIGTRELNEGSPAWSPDGSEIYYSAGPRGENVVGAIGLWSMDVATGETRLVQNDPDLWETMPCWSADGQCLAYCVFQVQNWMDPLQVARYGIYLWKRGDNEPHKIADRVFGLAWHPSLPRMACMRLAGDAYHLWVIDVNGHDIQDLRATDPDSGKPWWHTPCWSPDGSYLAFEARSIHGSDICAIRSDGTGYRRVLASQSRYTKPIYYTTPAWAPR